MRISVFDLFKIGIGPSSSHTVGPMKAALRFVTELAGSQQLAKVAAVEVELYGSLGATGKGHGSDTAVLLGLMGEAPESVAIDSVAERIAEVDASEQLRLNGEHTIHFPRSAIHFLRRSLPFHPNGMRLTASDANGTVISDRTFYSVGGGFVVEGEGGNARLVEDTASLPYPFDNAAQLLAHCKQQNQAISSLVLVNESTWRDVDATRNGLLAIWQVMQDCVTRGCEREGILPGGMKVRRRAAELQRQLLARTNDVKLDPLAALDWVSLYALAVNEENAAGGRVVTAPTNGAAGIIPAVLHYYTRFVPSANEQGVVRFLLTAGAIGMLYKKNASISGAEVGCQGEVGVACSMAAGALAEVLGGSPQQVENAAEIGMEHHLGLTCDPVGGLVQIPCIERNAMASVTAIQAARLALHGDGKHFVSLDRVIKTMRDTGADMKSKYKETARGGLAVNVVEC
jgi:L-serine dehydratase